MWEAFGSQHSVAMNLREVQGGFARFRDLKVFGVE